MGQTLTNGIYLPAEGERNCYEGLAANWTFLDGMIGGYNAHIGNATIHVTSADKQAWNGKADASALTAHTGDTTIHVTAEDKQAWDGHVADTTIHVTSADKQAWNGKADNSALTAHTGDTTIHVTAEDKNKWDAVTSKADDSAVVHKSGNETKSGELTLLDKLNSSDIIPKSNLTYNLGNSDYKYLNIYSYMLNAIGRYLGNEASTNQRTNITLYANRDTQEQSCGYITRHRQNRAQGALQPTDLQKIGFDVLENSVRTNNVFDIQCTNWLNDVPQMVYLVSSVPSYSYGKSSNKALFNDLNPSSLGMPDLDNGIDISSYIAQGTGHNEYTPPANGYVSIILKNNAATAIFLYQGDFGRSSFAK